MKKLTLLGKLLRLIIKKTQANLFSTIGKDNGRYNIMVHSDAVPAISSDWISDPFVARDSGNKIFGRGTSDMKDLLLCTLAVAPLFADEKLLLPIHFSYTFDEETGCLGAPLVLNDLQKEI